MRDMILIGMVLATLIVHIVTDRVRHRIVDDRLTQIESRLDSDFQRLEKQKARIRWLVDRVQDQQQYLALIEQRFERADRLWASSKMVESEEEYRAKAAYEFRDSIVLGPNNETIPESKLIADEAERLLQLDLRAARDKWLREFIGYDPGDIKGNSFYYP